MIDWEQVLGPCMKAFGEPVTFRHMPDGTEEQLQAVFDAGYLELEPMGRGGPGVESMAFGLAGGISTSRPMLGVQLSQFQVPPQQDDQAIIRGHLYIVREVQADSHGAAKLLLSEAEEELGRADGSTGQSAILPIVGF